MSEESLAGFGKELPWCLAKKKTAKQYREVMSKPVIQYHMDAELPGPIRDERSRSCRIFSLCTKLQREVIRARDKSDLYSLIGLPASLDQPFNDGVRQCRVGYKDAAVVVTYFEVWTQD